MIASNLIKTNASRAFLANDVVEIERAPNGWISTLMLSKSPCVTRLRAAIGCLGQQTGSSFVASGMGSSSNLRDTVWSIAKMTGPPDKVGHLVGGLDCERMLCRAQARQNVSCHRSRSVDLVLR